MTADGRIDRERNRSLGMALDLRTLLRSGDGARQFVQVYDGGALPTAGDKVYLTHPAVLTFDDTEGAAWSGAIDSAVTLPVVVLGSRAPAAGDYLVAHLAGGRWVAESGGAVPSLTCFPCAIPKQTLFVDVINPVTGNYTVTLTYNPGVPNWSSGCTHGLLYGFACVGGIAQFGVTYYLSGNCPTGQAQQCSTGNAPPLQLQLNSWTCSPFSLVYIVSGSGCPVLGSGGYSQFTVRT